MENGDAHLIERKLDGQTLLEGGFLTVRRDRVCLPDGAQATREYVVHPGAVAVVPLLDDGRMVVERQFRYPLHRVIVEVPAGKIDPGEATLQCAARELFEETGYQAQEWALAGRMHPTAAYTDEFIEIWFARGLRAGRPQLDEGEFIEVMACAPEDLMAQARAGELTDAKTLIALFWWQQWQLGLWSPSWQPAPVAPAEWA